MNKMNFLYWKKIKKKKKNFHKLIRKKSFAALIK